MLRGSSLRMPLARRRSSLATSVFGSPAWIRALSLMAACLARFWGGLTAVSLSSLRAPRPLGRRLCRSSSARRLLPFRRLPSPPPRQSGPSARSLRCARCGIPSLLRGFIRTRPRLRRHSLPSARLMAAGMPLPSCISASRTLRLASRKSRRWFSASSVWRFPRARRCPSRRPPLLRCLRRCLHRPPWWRSSIWCGMLQRLRPVPSFRRRRLPRPRPRRRCSRRSD